MRVSDVGDDILSLPITKKPPTDEAIIYFGRQQKDYLGLPFFSTF